MTENQAKEDDKDSKMIGNKIRPQTHPFVGPEAHVEKGEKTQGGLHNGAILFRHVSGVKLDVNDVV